MTEKELDDPNAENLFLDYNFSYKNDGIMSEVFTKLTEK